MASKPIKEEEEEEILTGIEAPSKRMKSCHELVKSCHELVKNMDVEEEDEYGWINDMLLNDDFVPLSLDELLGTSETVDSNFDLYPKTTDQDFFFSTPNDAKDEGLFGSNVFATLGKKAAEGIKSEPDQQCGNSMTSFDSVLFNSGSRSRDVSNALIRKSSSYVNNSAYTNIIATAPTRQEGSVAVVPSATTTNSRRTKGNWVPVGPDILPQAEWCPASVKDYLLGAADKHSKRIDHNSKTTKVRMHISYLGWRIECCKRDGATSNSILKIRYTSPDNKTFYSLADVCRSIEQPLSRNSLTDTKQPVGVANKDGYGSGVCKLSGGKSTEIVVRSNVKLENVDEEEYNNIKPNYCPQALTAWVNYNLGSDENKRDELKKSGGSARSMALQAKEHLRAVGWVFYPTMKHGTKKEIRYRSPLPPNPSFSSLVTACKRCMKDSKLSENKI